MYTKLKKRKLIITLILAMLFTIMQIVGYQISMIYGTSVHQSAFFQDINVLSVNQLIFLGPIELLFWWLILYALFAWMEKRKLSSYVFSHRVTIVLWIIFVCMLLVCWLPCLLAGYPGFYNYDSFNQVPQVLYDEVPYSTHHPIIHTLFMGKIIAWGYHNGETLNDGVLLHSIIQMLICAVCFSYLIIYILKKTGKYIYGAIAALYYAFFPPIALFVLSCTKDVLFSILLQFTIIFTYEMCGDIAGTFASKWKLLRFVIVALLMCMFRKNGIYIIVALLPCIFFIWKEYRKQLVPLLGLIICLYVIANKTVVYMLDAQQGSVKEALSVPFQQIARVYNEYGEDAFTSDELALIYEGISEDELLNYNPLLSDNIKNEFDYDAIIDHEIEFLSLWIQKGTQYPYEYLRAFLDNTYQAWYPGTSINDKSDEEEACYFDMSMCAGAERESRIPQLLNFYNKIALEYYYQKLPIIRLLFSIGAMFWVVLFAMGYAIYQKNRWLITALLMVLLCCATVMLGPVSVVRYYLILFFGFPVVLGLLSDGTHKAMNS